VEIDGVSSLHILSHTEAFLTSPGIRNATSDLSPLARGEVFVLGFLRYPFGATPASRFTKGREMTDAEEAAERFVAFERAVHDRIAETYNDAFTPVTSRAAGPLLAAVGAGPGLRLLDVACGPGTVAAAAAALEATPTGIDLSPRMVALAARLHPAIPFVESSAEDIPFPDSEFSAVVCSFGVGHFPRPERALAEFARILIPGGRVALSWWDTAERSRINGLFFEALRDLGIAPPAALPAGPSAFHFSDDERLRDLLAGAGFGDVAVEPHETVHTLPDVDALWSLARGSFARVSVIIEGLDPPARAALRAKLAEKAEAYRDGQGLHVPIAFKIASGRRG
jgi:SAM-dependent methyltransferase